ncbi:MAG TPA: hypothetical protein VHS99_07120 [Chloroflexota bacterium]|jgi:uncharacterized protein YukE|nr:hypothetical protein [Chloroflexota bacterium]
MRSYDPSGRGGDLADPDALDRAAKAIEGEAKSLREAVVPYGRAARTMQWRGVAAAGFQDQVQLDCTHVDAMAERLEQMAAAIRKGAVQVRQELERRRKAEQQAAERRSIALASRMARMGY